MGDVLQHTRDAIEIFDGDLIIGNHDSITLFGTQSQVRLRDYSKAISKILLRNNDELELAIEEVISEIEKSEAQMAKKKLSFFGLRNRKKELTKEYNRIATYIERLCLFFQMQQAQLLKEIKLLEKLSATVGESIVALENDIAIGEKTLCNKTSTEKQSDSYHPLNFINDSENMDVWYARLTRRIDDLRVSHTVALQNQAQIRFLYENDLVLLDRIAAAISNTFPIWQSQMVVMLGIERLEKRLEDQEKVFSNSSQQEQLDVERIVALNRKLKDALNEADSLEKKDLRIRKEFREATHNIERG